MVKNPHYNLFISSAKYTYINSKKMHILLCFKAPSYFIQILMATITSNNFKITKTDLPKMSQVNVMVLFQNNVQTYNK